MCKAILPTFFLLATVASGATLRIPSADGALIVDGRVEEDIWARAAVLPLQPKEFGAPFPAGGEMRAVVRRGYLCLSARLPESGRVVARSIGRDPVWWREDLVTWTFRVHDSQGRNKSLTLTVNPLGAYSVDPRETSSDLQQGTRASAFLGLEGWSVEAAIPVARLANIGFLAGERIRTPRPDAPELRWHWPGVNDPLDFELPSGGSNPQPPTFVEKDWRTPAPPAARVASADPLVVDLASVPHQVWTVAERKYLGVREMWERDLRSRVSERP